MYNDHIKEVCFLQILSFTFSVENKLQCHELHKNKDIKNQTRNI